MIIVSDRIVYVHHINHNNCDPTIIAVINLSREVSYFLYIILLTENIVKVDYVWVRKWQYSSKHQLPYSFTVQTLD